MMMGQMLPPLFPACNSTRPWRPLGKLLDLYVLPAVCLSGLFLNLACIVVFIQRKTIILYHSSLTTNGHQLGWKHSLETCPERIASPERGGVRNRPNCAHQDSLFAFVRTRHARRRSHPLVPILIVLSCCDSLQLLFSLLVLFLPALHDHLEMDPRGIVAQIAYLATGGLAGGLLAANCASIWTMCFISFQRHQAIVRPLSTISASKSSSHLPLLLIALSAFLFNAPVWFEFRWSIELAANGHWPIIWHQPSSLAQNEMYRFLMHKVLYPICVYLIPLVLISVLNARILAFIRSSSRIQSVGHRQRMAKERRSVRLLISIVLLFFLCHTGGLIIRFVDLRQHGNEPCFVFAKDFVNFLFNINSFANPMLYFFFTKQFRDLRTTWANHTSRSSTTTMAAPSR